MNRMETEQPRMWAYNTLTKLCIIAPVGVAAVALTVSGCSESDSTNSRDACLQITSQATPTCAPSPTDHPPTAEVPTKPAPACSVYAIPDSYIKYVRDTPAVRRSYDILQKDSRKPSPAAIAAIVGSEMYETRMNSGPHPYTSSYGVLGWRTGEGQNRLQSYADAHNKSMSSLKTQNAFVLTDIKRPGANPALKNFTTETCITRATKTFVTGYLFPIPNAENIIRRETLAEAVDKLYS